MFLLRRKMTQGWVHKPRHNRHFECHQRCNFQSDELISGVYCHFFFVFLTYRNLKQSNAKAYISWSLLVVMCRGRGTNCTKRHWESQVVYNRASQEFPEGSWYQMQQTKVYNILPWQYIALMSGLILQVGISPFFQRFFEYQQKTQAPKSPIHPRGKLAQCLLVKHQCRL